MGAMTSPHGGRAHGHPDIAGLFMNMDKAIGADFDKGLANLDGVVEGR
jgi:hypothetical protein